MALVLWGGGVPRPLRAQVTLPGQEGEKKRLVVRTNGAPIPFATVLNTSTGQAMAADAQHVREALTTGHWDNDPDHAAFVHDFFTYLETEK